MRTSRRLSGPVLLTGLLILAMHGTPLVGRSETGQAPPAPGIDPERKAFDKLVHDLLRDVINAGADLYNQGDRAGCYHLYRGSVLTVRPLLSHHTDLQKRIDHGLADAERQPSMGARAFALRSILDQVRTTLKPADTAKPPEEKKEKDG